MGMDIALGLVVLALAVRGYLRGFVLQAIRLVGLVACVFLANPIRDYAQPYLAPQLPTVGPQMLSLLTWWAAAGLSFIVLTGLAGMTYRLSRHKTLGEAEPNHADQGAGFVLGAAKGLVAAVALAYAFDQYGLEHLKNVRWVDDQTRGSQAMAWSREHQPAEKLWRAQPVQVFVAHVRRNGLPASGSSPVEEIINAADGPPAPVELPPPDRQAKSEAMPPLRVPPRSSPRPGTPDFLKQFDEELQREGIARGKGR